ncbi:MAG: TrkH family potassium uptake protein [Clostridiales bacterium]|nr:TrkH family potassium uptake protein [Clostridiales bacterium]
MNYKVVLSILGKTMLIGAGLLLFPLFVGLVCKENLIFSYLIPIAIFLVMGIPLAFIKVTDKSIYAKEGFVIVALVWIILSAVGCLPFVLSGYIPNYADAFFETVSGFTTTGASIVSDIEIFPKGLLFWRSFTHWIGGMGVLVFVLAILPGDNVGAMHIFRAESPGPEVSKLVSKISFTARILYGIYLLLTVLEVVMLLCGGMNFFESLLHSFATAGTGGFGVKNDSITSYNSYLQIVIAIFMFLFSLNFNFFYLIAIGQIGKVFKSEEFRVYTGIVIVSTLIIAVNIFVSCVQVYENFGIALKDSFFQVVSIVSTTGFSTADFDKWPELSHSILMLLMVTGCCAGSTGGGIKISRVVILIKSAFSNLRKVVRPRTMVCIKFEGEPVAKETSKNINTYLLFWLLMVIASVLLLSLDPFGNFETNFSATLACIGNIGPGFDLVGATCNYSGYNEFSKILLSFVMLAGRLEIFPILILFFPHTWKKH